MFLPFYKCLHCSARTLLESRVKNALLARVVGLGEVPTFLVLVKNGGTFHASSVWTDADWTIRSALKTTRYHVHFFKESYGLPDSIGYPPDFKKNSASTIYQSS